MDTKFLLHVMSESFIWQLILLHCNGIFNIPALFVKNFYDAVYVH
jgi:hypothetical protein